MKKTLLTVILVLSLVVLVSKFITFLPASLGVKESAGIRVLSEPEGADVFIDNQNVGKTPYESDSLDVKEVSLKLTAEAGTWEGKVRLNSKTITFVSRDLSDDTLSSAGEILGLSKGRGATFISSPGGASVAVDGQTVGQTPGTFDVSTGEHTFVISKEGFKNRSIKASVPEGYNLKLAVDLASETEIEPQPSLAPITTIPTLKVLDTPTGFLRVRDRASTAGREIGRVSPGDQLEFIEVSGSWTKIKMPDGVEGFVSNQYVSKN